MPIFCQFLKYNSKKLRGFEYENKIDLTTDASEN